MSGIKPELASKYKVIQNWSQNTWLQGKRAENSQKAEVTFNLVDSKIVHRYIIIFLCRLKHN